jgi:hypothetical protein
VCEALQRLAAAKAAACMSLGGCRRGLGPSSTAASLTMSRRVAGSPGAHGPCCRRGRGIPAPSLPDLQRAALGAATGLEEFGQVDGDGPVAAFPQLLRQVLCLC